MGQRRMFSPSIVESDAFLDMPASSQALYFHLGMYADDDGFVNPKKIMRLMGAADDDIKVLISKRFVLPFECGVVVIKHWLIHNLIRTDLYKETQYKKEKSLLGLNDNGAYTELREGVSELKQIEAPEWLLKRRSGKRAVNVPSAVCKDRLGKVRLGQDRLEREAEASPSQVAKTFFNDIDEQERIIDLLEAKGYNRTIVVREVIKFVSYWTEKNKSGSKERYEMEKTFEVGKRLATWFSRVKEFSGQSNKGKEIIF